MAGRRVGPPGPRARGLRVEPVPGVPPRHQAKPQGPLAREPGGVGRRGVVRHPLRRPRWRRSGARPGAVPRRAAGGPGRPPPALPCRRAAPAAAPPDLGADRRSRTASRGSTTVRRSRGPAETRTPPARRRLVGSLPRAARAPASSCSCGPGRPPGAAAADRRSPCARARRPACRPWPGRHRGRRAAAASGAPAPGPP